MRHLIAFLIVDGLLVIGATANQFYQGWATREALKPIPVVPVDECRDAVVVAYPGKSISDTGWLSCTSDQDMKTEYPTKKGDWRNLNGENSLPYMIIHCTCKEENISDTGV